MGINISQVCLPATELIVAVGTNVSVGVLQQNPVIIIFDNQSTTGAVLSINSVSWKTFAAGEALVLDLRGNHGYAANFTFDIGTQFTVNGAANGNFSISYVYAKNS